MVIILSRPYQPDVRPPAPFEPLRMVWEGWDGSLWDLNDRHRGVALIADGVEGLGDPVITRFTSTSRVIPGHRLRGWRAEARDVFWPIYIGGPSTLEYLTRHDDFLRTVHPDREGVWRVTAGNQTRSLWLTGTFEEVSQVWDRDPLFLGWGKYAIALEAQQPFWEGEPITAGPWSSSAPKSFFGTTGAPPFFISDANVFGQVQITNPGDVDVYGTWVVDGPVSSVEIGIGSAVMYVPFAVPDGQRLLLDTDPRRATVRMGPVSEMKADPTTAGADMTAQLGLQPFAPLPSGGEVLLHVDATGTGNIQFQFVPLFMRAY